jgi:hypothetical protein
MENNPYKRFADRRTSLPPRGLPREEGGGQSHKRDR